MGNCQDCSKKSADVDKLLENEAKRIRTHKRQIVTKSVLNVVKLSASKLFNNNIGQCIYQTLVDEEYQYIDDILYDLNCYQSNIIWIASQNIVNNTLNKLKWNDNNKEILYKLLLKVFKHNITDIDILVNECTLSLAKCSHNQLIDNINTIITNIHTVEIEPDTQLINAKHVKQMFDDENITGSMLANMSTHTFIKLAKEYNLTTSQGRKLLNAFRKYPFDKSNDTETKQIEGEKGEFADDFEILHDAELKEKTLNLCREQTEINGNGKDKGFIKFCTYYLNTKTVNDIFNKSKHISIANAYELMNVLLITILLYKVKVFQIQNKDGSQKLQLNKLAMKSVAKYLSIWMVVTYGENETDFNMTKQEFQENIHLYLEQFIV